MNSFGLYIVGHMIHLLPDTRCFGLKRAFYRMCGAKIGDNVRICSSVIICGDGELSVGDNTWIGHGTIILASARVSIGANVNIAPRVYIGTGTHEIDVSGPAIAGKGYSLPISIGDGVWLCANSSILAGRTIGSHSIIAMGAIVIDDVPIGELWGGCPARKIKNLQ